MNGDTMMNNNLSVTEHPYKKSRMRQMAIRLIKENPGMYGTPEIVIESDFNVTLLNGGIHKEESQSEYFFFVEYEEKNDSEDAIIGFRIKWPGCSVREVICEENLIPFTFENSLYHFEIDVAGFTGKTKTLYIHSRFFEPGMTIRIEQNHPHRVAGKYKNISWPQTQFDAAQHYMYASRIALLALNIPDYLVENQLGYVALLGFESNNPVHGDFPPHWHLIFRWPNYAGSQAPHIYLNEKGENTHNIVYIDGIPGVKRTHEPEEWCYFKDMYARDAFAMKVCADGGLAITAPNKPIIRFTPYHDQNGVEVYLNDELQGFIKVWNDTQKGQMKIQWTKLDGAPLLLNSYQEEIEYHPLLGNIIRVTK